MKWRYETFKQKRERLSKWRKWFAWYPVKVNGIAYWLEYIERRDMFFNCVPYHFWSADFRPIQGEE